MSESAMVDEPPLPPEKPAAEPPMPAALPQATAPRMQPWRGFLFAAGLHGVLLGGLLIALKPHMLKTPPDEPMINMVMEAAPAAAPALQPVKLAVPPPPAPVVDKPALLPLPMPPVPPPPAPQQAARPQPQKPAATIGPAHPAKPAMLQIATIPAKPDDSSDNPPPDYPESAREQGEQGQVLLSIRVLANGEPASVAVVQSSGYKMLDEAAVQAVSSWHFQPAFKGMKPVNSVLPFWIAFKLN